MILADTSAWVEYDRATGSAVDDRLAELIGNGGPLAITRGMVDCMIAAVAWRHGATLLARDSELRLVAHVVGINLDSASVDRPTRHELFDALTERRDVRLPSSPTAIIRVERDNRAGG